MATYHASDFIRPHQKEAVKQYIVYDGLDRMEYHYVATVDADHGDKCLGTQYAYDGTSGRVVKVKEFITTWDSTWDI